MLYWRLSQLTANEWSAWPRIEVADGIRLAGQIIRMMLCVAAGHPTRAERKRRGPACPSRPSIVCLPEHSSGRCPGLWRGRGIIAATETGCENAQQVGGVDIGIAVYRGVCPDSFESRAKEYLGKLRQKLKRDVVFLHLGERVAGSKAFASRLMSACARISGARTDHTTLRRGGLVVCRPAHPPYPPIDHITDWRSCSYGPASHR